MKLGDLVYIMQPELVQICVDDWEICDTLRYNSTILKSLYEREVVAAQAIKEDVIRVELKEVEANE